MTTPIVAATDPTSPPEHEGATTVAAPPGGDRWAPRWLFPAAVAAVLAPLVTAGLAQVGGHWTPVHDLAMTELRVRDVGGRHTPLIGLQGRIGPTGSHPGPLSFYLLAPVYRLLGASAFALQVATVAFHAAAATTALWVARRRRDGRAVVAVALVLLLLVQGWGLSALVEPWNPYLPLLWFVAFVVAAWAVVDGDLPMLVPAVVAASICAQTHVPYLAVTVALGGVVTLVAGVGVARRGGPERRSALRWLLAGGVVGLLLWVPPLVDEVVHEPGNLSQIVDHLGSPEEAPIGVREASRLVLERLDGWQLVVGETRHPGTYIRTLSGPGPQRSRGVATLALWVVAAGAAVALRHRRLLALHGLVAAGGVVAVAAASRIYGVPWPYLLSWIYAVTALMVLAIAATAAVGLRRWRPVALPTRVFALGGVALVAALSVRLLVVAPDASPGTPDDTAQLRRLVGPAVAALDAGDGSASGRDGAYLVTWYDATLGGAEGIGLVNELERRGFHVGVEDRHRVEMTPHRVLPAADATAQVVLASGSWIDRWAAVPGVVRVAEDDPRTPAERAEFADVRSQAISALEAAGRADLVARVDEDLFDVALNSGVPGSASLLLARLLDLGVPVAVFVAPAEATL